MVFRFTPALVIHALRVVRVSASGSPDAKPSAMSMPTRLLRNALMNAPMGPPSPGVGLSASFRGNPFQNASQEEADWLPSCTR